MSGDKFISSTFFSDMRAQCYLNQPCRNKVNLRKKLMLTFSSCLHHRNSFSSPRTRRYVVHSFPTPTSLVHISLGSTCCCARLLLCRPSVIHQQNCESFTSHYACITRSRTGGPCISINYYTCASCEYSRAMFGHKSSLLDSNCSRCNPSDC